VFKQQKLHMKILDTVQVVYEGKTYEIQRRASCHTYTYWVGLIDGAVRTSPELLYLDAICILAPGCKNPLYAALENAVLDYLGLGIEDDI
jgi:hypothetical protein